MTVKELQEAVLNAVIRSSDKMIDVVSVSYEIRFLNSSCMKWHFIKCHDAEQLITVESKYFIDAWQKAFEKAFAEFGEDLEGISFLKQEIPL